MNEAEIARALGQSDVEQRRRAVLAIAGRSEPTLGALLLRALGDGDWRVREEAIRVGRDAAERLGVIPELVAALQRADDISLRNAALALLKLLGRAARADLLAALPGLDPGSRKLVIEALGHGGDPEVVRKLAEAANARDLNLSTAAIEALASIGGAEAEAVLRRKLESRSPYERIAALDALDQMQSCVPYPLLVPLLDDRMTLRGAVRALGRSQAREAVPALLAALLDRSDSVAGAAAVALLRLSADPGPGPTVRDALASAPAEAHARLRVLSEKPDAVGTAATHLLDALAPPPSPARATPPWGQPIAVPSAAVEPRTSPWAGTPRLPPDEFRGIAELIRRHSGIRLIDELRPTVERRLGDRLTALRLSSFADYHRMLREDVRGDGEIERAIELIATNETYFFRDLPQLRSFEHEVLPALHGIAHGRRSLSVWSAGCSTGEEAYTLAILLARAPQFAGWNLRVVGNDISRRVVQTARKAVYRAPSFRALPVEYESYFVKTPEGLAVDPSIRAMCHFARFNLLDESSAAMFGRVDAIFCRNVLIYFDDEARRRVISTFYERLQPGGYLMLGHSDSLLNITTAFELAHLSGDLAYRKPLTADRQR